MPVPVAVRSPDKGAMTPIFTTLADWAPPPAVLPPVVVSFLSPPQETASSNGSTTTADLRQRGLDETGI
jgi:hypothetical protein